MKKDEYGMHSITQNDADALKESRRKRYINTPPNLGDVEEYLVGEYVELLKDKKSIIKNTHNFNYVLLTYAHIDGKYFDFIYVDKYGRDLGYIGEKHTTQFFGKKFNPLNCNIKQTLSNRVITADEIVDKYFDNYLGRDYPTTDLPFVTIFYKDKKFFVTDDWVNTQEVPLNWVKITCETFFTQQKEAQDE